MTTQMAKEAPPAAERVSGGGMTQAVSAPQAWYRTFTSPAAKRIHAAGLAYQAAHPEPPSKPRRSYLRDPEEIAQEVRRARIEAEVEAERQRRLAEAAARRARRAALLLIPVGPVETIAREISLKYGISMALLRGRGHKRHTSWARQEVFYRALHKHPDVTTTMIAAWFSGRDHSTIVYGAQAHAARMGLEPAREATPRSSPPEGERRQHVSRAMRLDRERRRRIASGAERE